MEYRKIKDLAFFVGLFISVIVVVCFFRGTLNWESVKWLLSDSPLWVWIIVSVVSLAVGHLLLELAFGEFKRPPYRSYEFPPSRAEEEEDRQYDEYKERDPKWRNFWRIFVSVLIIIIVSCIRFC